MQPQDPTTTNPLSGVGDAIGGAANAVVSAVSGALGGGTTNASTTPAVNTSGGQPNADLSTGQLDSPEAVLTLLTQKHGPVIGGAAAIPGSQNVFRYSFQDGSHVDMDNNGRISGQVLKTVAAGPQQKPQPVAVRQNAQGQLVTIDPSTNQETIVDAATKPASGTTPKAIVRTVGGNLVEMDPDGSNARVVYQGSGDTSKQEVAQITQSGRVQAAQVQGDSRVTVAQTAAGARIQVADASNATKIAINQQNVQGRSDVAATRAAATTGAAQIRGQSLVDVTALKSTLGPNSPYLASVSQESDGSYTVNFTKNPNWTPPEVGQATADDPYIITRNPDGSFHTSPNPQYRPKLINQGSKDEPTLTFFDARTGEVSSQPNPAYVNTTQQGISDTQSAINSVQQDIANGSMTPDEGSALIDTLRQSLQYKALGITPDQYFQQQSNQANLGMNVLGKYQEQINQGNVLGQQYMDAAMKSTKPLPAFNGFSAEGGIANAIYGPDLAKAHQLIAQVTPITDRLSALKNLAVIGQAKAALTGAPTAPTLGNPNPQQGPPAASPGVAQGQQTSSQGPDAAFMAAAAGQPNGQTPAFWAQYGGQPTPGGQ